MNPLNSILNWFDNQTQNVKVDFVALSAHFLPDNSIERELDRDKQLELFRNFLIGDSLSPKEVVQRTLFLKALINFSLDGRETEEGWEKSRVINEKVDKKINSEGHKSDMYEKFMVDFSERKDKWIAWANEWYQLIQTDLSDSRIANWYFLTIQK